MTTSPSYHQVVTIGNHGAVLIDQGHYSQAANQLTTALSVNKQILADLNGPCTHSRSLKRPCAQPSLLRQVCMASGVSNYLEESDMSCNFVYRNTMHIPSNGHFSESPMELHVSLSIVILFNLSLCYHLAGMNEESGSPSSRKEALHKSISLYTLLQQMLVKEQDLDSRVILLLASTNNLGHVHSLFGDMASANKCFQWLLDTLFLLNNSMWTRRNHVSLEGFLQNTIHLVLTASHTAQAA